MTAVGVVGHPATTTAAALAATWPDNPVTVVEADPSGGALGAWLDIASGSLATLAAAGPAVTLDDVTAATLRSPRGLQALTAPLRPAAASTAVAAAASAVVHLFGALDDHAAIVDLGRPGAHLQSLLAPLDAVVVVHRQSRATAASAAAGFVGVSELLDTVRRHGHEPIVALVGDSPYRTDEVAEHLGVRVVGWPIDPMAAAALAGRPTSQRRLRRSPLWRAASSLATELATDSRAHRAERHWVPMTEPNR